MQRYDVRNKMVDALEQACADTGEYYKLNHCSSQQLCELEDLLVTWLKSIGIKFE